MCIRDSRNGSWEIIPNINSNLEVVVNELYDYLSSSSPTSGTSLLALNLNTSNKTEVLVNDSGPVSYTHLTLPTILRVKI